MGTFDLYRFNHNNILTAKDVVELALGIELQPHESLYLGDYYLGYLGKERFSLQMNFNSYENELNEEKFPEKAILLYVGPIPTERAEELKNTLLMKINDLSFLRRRIIQRIMRRVNLELEYS